MTVENKEVLPEDQPSSPPTPEPELPLRHYIGRAFGFEYKGVMIQGSFYSENKNNQGPTTFNADGTYGEKPYDNLMGLMLLAKADSNDYNFLTSKINSFLRA